MQLSPREYFTVARGLEDHTDGATYYVRATIRNARTDELLDTINLTNQGDGHRFSLPWQVPADPSGQGFYILITTSVYTDSGYTTKSELYGDKYDTYLVHRRASASFGAGGGGADVDYKKVRKIVEEVVSKALQELPQPEKEEVKEVDLEPVLSSLQSISSSVQAIKVPEQKEPDLTPVLTSLEEVKDMVQDTTAMQAHMSDMVEVKNALMTVLDEKMTGLDSLKEEMGKMIAGIRAFFAGDVDKIVESTGRIEQFLKKIAYVVFKNDVKELEKEEEETPDV